MAHVEREQPVEMAKARPITALILGLMVGLALAVLLQQGGVWPLDKLSVFLLPALIALVLILIARIGRAASPVALTIALILLIAPLAYGLTGIGEINEKGQLNGGCTVDAFTDVDTTVVTDTSRSDPFVVVPDGPLSWFATSPGPITNHEWEIYVNVGGFEIVVASDGDENADEETISEGAEPTLEGYVEDLTGQTGEQIRGIYEVGGFIAGDGGGCDGFGFVEIEGGFPDTLISWIALIVALLALIIFLLIVFTGRTRPIEGEAPNVDVDGSNEALTAVGGGAGTAGIAAATDASDDSGNGQSGEDLGAISDSEDDREDSSDDPNQGG